MRNYVLFLLGALLVAVFTLTRGIRIRPDQPRGIVHAPLQVVAKSEVTMTSVPIFLYHHIRPYLPEMDATAKGLSVTPESFGEQMKYLAANGYHTITLLQLYKYLNFHQPLPEKPVILTFDDGYQDFFTQAYPILKKYNLLATVLIISGKLGTTDYLTWEQITELDVSGKVEITAHTMNHSKLTVIPIAEAKKEITGSKMALEEHLKHSVDFFGYPYGKYNSEVVKEVKSAGFLGALTTHPGIVQEKAKLFEMKRVRLGNADVGERLEKKLEIILGQAGK